MGDAITCPALPAPSNGTRLGCPGNKTMYYDTVCQFSCNNGYTGSGSQVRRCQHNGTWSGQDFTCQIINCTSLTVNPAGPLRMSSCNNDYGAECNFTCTIGYRFNGSSTVTCVAPGNQHPGVWNNTIPTCEAITCPALPAPSNGTGLGCPENTTMYYNTTCQFSCNNGYIGSGSQVRRCQHNGTWSGQDFACQIINCTSLMVDPGGPLRMSSCGNDYGSKCNFSCTIGYRLNGSSAVTCVAPGNQHPGVWNNTIPTCEGELEKLKFRQCYYRGNSF
ncbi:E-selectin-like [Oculina patagonica]